MFLPEKTFDKFMDLAVKLSGQLSLIWLTTKWKKFPPMAQRRTQLRFGPSGRNA